MTEQTEQNEQITVVKRTQEGNLNMFCIPTKSTRRPLLTNLNVGQQLERQSISLDTTLDRIKLSIWLKSISPLNPLPMSLVGLLFNRSTICRVAHFTDHFELYYQSVSSCDFKYKTLQKKILTEMIKDYVLLFSFLWGPIN